MVQNVAKVVRDALAHAVWPRGDSASLSRTTTVNFVDMQPCSVY